MARNEFGCICDMCGYYNSNRRMFYRLIIPAYQNDMANDTQTLDYCFECYKDLKVVLQMHYTK